MDEGGEPVAFQAGVQIIVLGGTVVNPEAGANHALPVPRARTPRYADPGIKVFVICVVQGRVPGTWRRVDGRREGTVSGS